MSIVYSSGNISSPFRVKNVGKFQAWCEDAGLLTKVVEGDTVVIQPNDDGEWEMTEMDDNGQWADYKVELGKVLGEWMLPGQVVILYCAWHNSRQSVTSAGGDVTVIGSDGKAHTLSLPEVAAGLVAQFYPEATAFTSGVAGMPVVVGDLPSPSDVPWRPDVGQRAMFKSSSAMRRRLDGQVMIETPEGNGWRCRSSNERRTCFFATTTELSAPE